MTVYRWRVKWDEPWEVMWSNDPKRPVGMRGVDHKEVLIRRHYKTHEAAEQARRWHWRYKFPRAEFYLDVHTAVAKQANAPRSTEVSAGSIPAGRFES